MKRVHVVVLAGLFVALLTAMAPAQSSDASRITIGEGQNSVTFWLESSLVRVFPGTKPTQSRKLDLLSPRNGRASFQVAVRSERIKPARVHCDATGDAELKIRVRRVGQISM